MTPTKTAIDTFNFMSIVAATVRVDGRFVSKAKAEQYGGTPTISNVKDTLKKGVYTATKADEDIARKVIEWARNDLAFRDEVNEYEAKLIVALGDDEVTSKDMGIAASGIAAFMREEREAEKRIVAGETEHYGNIGNRETLILTVDFIKGIRTAFGESNIIKLHDEDGHKFTMFSKCQFDVDSTYSMRVGIKNHEQDKFSGECVTILNAPKNIEQVS